MNKGNFFKLASAFKHLLLHTWQEAPHGLRVNDFLETGNEFEDFSNKLVREIRIPHRELYRKTAYSFARNMEPVGWIEHDAFQYGGVDRGNFSTHRFTWGRDG